MSIGPKYNRFEDSGSDFPDLLKVDTSNARKGKGNVNISTPSGRVITLAAKHIKPHSEKKGKGFGLPSFGKKTVEVKATDSASNLVKMDIKIKDLSAALGVSAKEITQAEKQGTLEEFINDKLQHGIMEKLEDLSQMPEGLQAPLLPTKKTEPESKPLSKAEDAAVDSSASSSSLHEVEKPVLIPKAVRENIIANLDKYGLTEEEFERIESFYTNYSSALEHYCDETTHLRKDEEDSPMPRSLVYVPNGPRKGLYILLKSKGGVKEIGLGAHNRATKMLHIDSGQIKVFRNGKADVVPPGEFLANQRAQDHSEFLAAGIPVKYKGPWRTRVREKNQPKDHLPRELDVDKIGFIMDWMEGGELFDTIQAKPPTYKESVHIALTIAKGLKCMHNELNMTHLDLKPENVFMTKAGVPKISDFGFASKNGSNISFCGSPGFIAPEVVVDGLLGGDSKANPASDIWSLGCIMAELTHGDSWYNWNGQGENDWQKLLYPAPVELRKGLLFPRRNESDHFDHWIDACLRVEPEGRPNADQLVEQLEKLYATL